MLLLKIEYENMLLTKMAVHVAEVDDIDVS